MTREEAIKKIKWEMTGLIIDKDVRDALETLIPELRESEDERIRKSIIECVKEHIRHGNYLYINGDKAIAYLEKQKEQNVVPSRETIVSPKLSSSDAGVFLRSLSDETLLKECKARNLDVKYSEETELAYRLNWVMQDYIKAGKDEEEQEHRIKCYRLFWDALEDSTFFEQKEQKPVMIQWTGKNLKEVIDFTGKSPRFGEWFKSWEEYENYVHTHNDILKLFCEDGSHYEVPIGAWIVKTPDGFNIPSLFKFVQKPAEWSEEDELMRTAVIQTLERFGGRGTTGMQIDWLKSLSSNLKKKNEDVAKFCSNEWSKEDETMLNKLIWAVHMKSISPCDEMDDRNVYEKYENFLKFLRPRSQGIYQQVVKGLRDMCDRYEQNGLFTDERARDFLGNVRVKCKDAIECAPILDEPHWKPSEEQMDRLFSIVAALRKDYCDDMADFLTSLYKQLYKLM